MHLFRIARGTIAPLLLAVSPLILQGQAPRPEAVGLRPDAPTYARHGPYWVGTREFVVKTSVEGRSLAATLWYPALNPTGMKEENAFTFNDATSRQVLTINGRAVPAASPDPSGKPYPLVVFSHGDDNSRLLSVFFLEHMASYGFAVLGIDHLRPDFERPKDVMSAIDFAEQLSTVDPAYPGFIDARHVAVAGHSSGGFTVLQLGGAKVQGGTADFLDSRVKALVPMAASGEAGSLDLSAVRLPTLLMRGSSDQLIKFAAMKGIYEALPAELKSMVQVAGGGHAMFLGPSVPGARYGSLDLNRAHDLINHFATAFLLDVLKGDKEAHKALLPEAVKFEEIQYMTTWK